MIFRNYIPAQASGEQEGVFSDEMVRAVTPTAALPGPQPGVYHRDEGKPRVDLQQFRALLCVAEVGEFGAKKYGERNWEEYADKWKYGQLLGSVLRHLYRWAIGEELDEESKLSHLAHAAWNILTLLELVITGWGEDDRTVLFTKPKERD